MAGRGARLGRPQLARLGLRRTGEIEQPHVYPWSTVLRVPTDGGDVWFKANDDALRHEAALVELLAAGAPTACRPCSPTTRARLDADGRRGGVAAAVVAARAGASTAGSTCSGVRRASSST